MDCMYAASALLVRSPGGFGLECLATAYMNNPGRPDQLSAESIVLVIRCLAL